MSRVFVNGAVQQVSLKELQELDQLAAEKKISREAAAELKLKKPAAKASKKKEG
jgi:hypothetical protein